MGVHGCLEAMMICTTEFLALVTGMTQAGGGRQKFQTSSVGSRQCPYMPGRRNRMKQHQTISNRYLKPIKTKENQNGKKLWKTPGHSAAAPLQHFHLLMFLEISAIWKRLLGNCVKTGSCPGRGFGYPDRGCLQFLVVTEPWEIVAECHCWNRMTCNAGPAFSPEAHSAFRIACAPFTHVTLCICYSTLHVKHLIETWDFGLGFATDFAWVTRHDFAKQIRASMRKKPILFWKLCTFCKDERHERAIRRSPGRSLNGLELAMVKHSLQSLG